jgi:hypothetical protein
MSTLGLNVAEVALMPVWWPLLIINKHRIDRPPALVLQFLSSSAVKSFSLLQ